jgi:splicing factor U2AF 65 kDa subunit
MQRASVAAPALMGGPMALAAPILAIEIIGGANLRPSKPTSILMLLNCVLPEDLEDDAEFEDIVVDIKDECARFGEVLEIIIPRPLEGAEIPGVGKVSVVNLGIYQVSQP